MQIFGGVFQLWPINEKNWLLLVPGRELAYLRVEKASLSSEKSRDLGPMSNQNGFKTQRILPNWKTKSWADFWGSFPTMTSRQEELTTPDIERKTTDVPASLASMKITLERSCANDVQVHHWRTVCLLFSVQTMGNPEYLVQFLEWRPIKRCSFRKPRVPREHSITGSDLTFEGVYFVAMRKSPFYLSKSPARSHQIT